MAGEATVLYVIIACVVGMGLLLLAVSIACLSLLRRLGEKLESVRDIGDRLELQLRAAASESRAERASELGLLEERISRALEQTRTEAFTQGQEVRSSVFQTVSGLSESLSNSLRDISALQGEQLRQLGERIESLTRTLSAGLQESSLSHKAGAESVLTQGRELLGDVERRIADLKAAIEQTLERLRSDNMRALEEVRVTVNDKLQTTLESRLGESFRLVGEQLEQVHRGLGEMQTLATGVGDLKKLMSNVKVRGTFGEVQLHALLEQMLAPHQYEQNVAVRPDSNDHVEFALRIPGPRTAHGEAVLMPIDAKFPVESYQRMVESIELGDLAAGEEGSKEFESAVRTCAKTISSKYIYPPLTTDFALMFVPTEGLYAEIARRPGMLEALHRDFRVLVAGPSTLAALLSSIQIGFRTYALQKRSSEVWKLLGVVKTEFLKFGDLLDGVRKKLDSASQNIDLVSRKSRTIERRLRGLETLSGEGAELPEVLPEEG